MPDAPNPASEYDRTDRNDPTLRATLWAVAATALLFTGFAAAGFSREVATGVGIGGALAVANLAVLARVGRAFLEQKDQVPWGIVGVLKLVLLVGGVWLLLKNNLVHPITLALGYGALPVGITVGALFGPKPPVEGAPPGTDRR